VPQGVDINIEDGVVRVKGPKGAAQAPLAAGLTVTRENGHLLVGRSSDKQEQRALHGLTRALLNNAVVGVSEGFSKILELRGVGYRAELAGKTLKLALGYSHPVDLALPQDVEAEVTPSTPTLENGYLAARITLRSHDKQSLGDFAADVRSRRPVEPYKRKGLRYIDEIVKRKVGKQGKGDK
jgi:large subunit ribosomal protein L6